MDSAQNKKSGKKTGRKKPKKITAQYLHNAGLYYLQRFAASRGQFRSVMLRKIRRSCMEHRDQDYESCAAMIEEIVEKFERAGLLNDELYTRGAVTSLRRQGKSKNAIVSKLRTRGVAASLVTETLGAQDTENSELRAALTVLRRKRAGPFCQEKEGRDNEKTLAALARAGFSYDTAGRALKMDRAEAEEILES